MIVLRSHGQDGLFRHASFCLCVQYGSGSEWLSPVLMQKILEVYLNETGRPGCPAEHVCVDVVRACSKRQFNRVCLSVH